MNDSTAAKSLWIIRGHHFFLFMAKAKLILEESHHLTPIEHLMTVLVPIVAETAITARGHILPATGTSTDPFIGGLKNGFQGGFGSSNSPDMTGASRDIVKQDDSWAGRVSGKGIKTAVQVLPFNIERFTGPLKQGVQYR